MVSYREQRWAQPIYDPDLPTKPTRYPRKDPKSRKENKEAWQRWEKLEKIIKEIESNPKSEWHGKKECHAAHCGCDKCSAEKRKFIREQSKSDLSI